VVATGKPATPTAEAEVLDARDPAKKKGKGGKKAKGAKAKGAAGMFPYQ
jgi:hypothetical protein